MRKSGLSLIFIYDLLHCHSDSKDGKLSKYLVLSEGARALRMQVALCYGDVSLPIRKFCLFPGFSLGPYLNLSLMAILFRLRKNKR